jgi:polysaccharide deacetylase family protein (PEP-CTERM system associated)
MLDDADARCTFFVLGWVAENHPEVVRSIVDQGHELASHGMEHRRVWQQEPEEFLEDSRNSRLILEDTGGVPVIGYRAASWSIDQRTPWAHDVLAKAGYQYSSSIYPVRHDHYGMPDAPIGPHAKGSSRLLEVPASVATVAGRRIPAAGGGFFRLFPLWMSEWLIRRSQAATETPYIFYFHPWEVDPQQPRIKDVSLTTRFRHYVNIDKVESRLQVLLRRFRWGRIDDLFLRNVGV